MKYILLLITLFPILTFGQNRIEGRIIDAKSNKPLVNANIYVNGTTEGCMTNKKGYFILENFTPPCQIGVSHVNYKPVMLSVTMTNVKDLIVKMKRRQVRLRQINVNNVNRRYLNVMKFKDNFLGSDYYGTKAVLKNDKALFFDHDYKMVSNKMPKGISFSTPPGNGRKLVHKKDGDYIVYKKAINTKVKANAPLLIDLPKLGYKIHAELIDFVLETPSINKNTKCYFLGYYYFEPYKMKSEREERRFENKRRRAYYNSSMHFCRSLYNNDLKRNGYQLIEKSADKKDTKLSLFSTDSIKTTRKNNTLKLYGLKGKHLFIVYNGKSNGCPRDLTTRKLRAGPQSEIYFASDTCTITANGIIPDNTIIFGGDISKKKVGALLPENYRPKL